MVRKADFTVFLFVVVVLLSLTSGMVSAAPVTQNITYQGKLTDAAGNPLTGTYSVTFKLYEVSSGGTALVTDTHAVQSVKGLFTTQITTEPWFFDGRVLWLGIKVGADPEMTPRQEIRPVPYALSLRPGAWITSEVLGQGVDPTNAINVQSRGGGIALNISTTGASCPGVFATTRDLGSNAIYGISEADGTAAVAGVANGSNSYSLFGKTTKSGSKGVYGESTQDVGVYGVGMQGGSFTTNRAGGMGYTAAGVNITTTYPSNWGIIVSARGDGSTGISSSTSGLRSYGVYVHTTNTSSPGVYAYTSGTDSAAVTGFSDRDAGIYGKGKTGGYFTTTEGGTDWGTDRRPAVNISTWRNVNPGITVNTTGSTSHGVYAETTGSGSHALWGKAMGPASNGVVAFSNQSPAIWAQTYRSDNKYGLQTPDLIRALGYETGSSDVAEYMPVSLDVTPGTVLVIGEDGKLLPSSIAYDTGVAGIVSTAPGVFLGAKEGGNPGEQLIAVAGRVPCKVDASYGPIHPRDLLTTSDNPGYAMKATNPQIGTVLGKAMGSLESGTGTIEVLVTLQ